MDYYLVQSQLPDRGFVDGSVTFSPELETYYTHVKTPLPADTVAEITLDARVRRLANDYFHATGGARIVSDSFKMLLEQHRTGIQFIPASLRDHGGRPVERTYWIAHGPEEVDAFDYERSDYGRKAVIAASVHQPPRKPVKVMFNTYLHAEKVDRREFFLLAHVHLWEPVISSEFYEICQAHRLNLHVTPL